MAEVNNAIHFDRNRHYRAWKIFCQLDVEGREVFDGIEYDLLYDAVGSPR